MKKNYLIVALAVIILLAFLIGAEVLAPQSQTSPAPLSQVLINKTVKVSVETAATPAAQYQGLSDRTSLCPDCGMIFPFVPAAPAVFVMRRMHFPLDMIWIADGKIVKIDANLPPEGEVTTHEYSAGQNVDAVLEVNGGFSQTHSLSVGDGVSY